MIRFAKAGDHPRLKALWAQIFGDTADAVDTYFSLRHSDENMLVDERENTIAGMLSMLPVTLLSGGGLTMKARYIYAVATHPDFRGLGISTALLDAAHEHMKGLGEAAALLVPASPSLFDFYGKRGYTTAFALNVTTLHASSLPPFPASGEYGACSAAEYTLIRDQAFSQSRLYVRWEESAVSYAVSTLAQNGGVIKLSWASGRGCAAWERMEDGILIRELALVEGDMPTALSILHQALNAGPYTVRMMEGTLPGADTKPFGMIHWLIPEPSLEGAAPYLSLALD